MTRQIGSLVFLILFGFASFAIAQASTPPQAVFEEVWTKFDEHYALFGARGVDWNALGEVYRPRVTDQTTEAELFDILTAMLGHLNDTHVFLQAASLGRDFSAGYLGHYLADEGLEGAMQLLQERPLAEHYFQDGPHYAGGGSFQYGWVGQNIGYLHFPGFNDAQGSAAAVDEILVALADALPLIVDMRRNSGGDDQVGKAIADRFADQRRLYMVTRDRVGPGHEDFGFPKYWHVEPAQRTFTKPVILLTGRLGVSAAENFALALRVLPHVTVVGDFTSGCFADMAWHSLSNGWRCSYSKNLFLDYGGRCWEGIGVPPDIMVRAPELGEDPDRTFETALALLAGDGPALQDESASAAAARISLVDNLVSDFQSRGLDFARDRFHESQRDLAPEQWYVNPDEINGLGYELLSTGMIDEAVAVFELYAEIYPLDANAYDSLGEGLMTRGDREKAIASYERSLELNPQNTNGHKMLAKLRAGD